MFARSARLCYKQRTARKGGTIRNGVGWGSNFGSRSIIERPLEFNQLATVQGAGNRALRRFFCVAVAFRELCFKASLDLLAQFRHRLTDRAQEASGQSWPVSRLKFAPFPFCAPQDLKEKDSCTTTPIPPIHPLALLSVNIVVCATHSQVGLVNPFSDLLNKHVLGISHSHSHSVSMFRLSIHPNPPNQYLHAHTAFATRNINHSLNPKPLTSIVLLSCSSFSPCFLFSFLLSSPQFVYAVDVPLA